MIFFQGSCGGVEEPKQRETEREIDETERDRTIEKNIGENRQGHKNKEEGRLTVRQNRENKRKTKVREKHTCTETVISRGDRERQRCTEKEREVQM